ncbi:hypothetical protein LDENG_00284540 [Lucifuga dentata]|nr:hypothetical protein LDENG_00284540 [Lucifuga dentata]
MNAVVGLLVVALSGVSHEECIHCRGENYRGKISTTENNFTCQRWDSQKSHEHSYTPSLYPDKYLEENYSSEPPTIVPELTCATGRGAAYRGTVAVTQSGKTCQSWSAQTPHKHDLTVNNFPCRGLEKNYCRNPENEEKLWCYTTDPETRWEYCNVSSCGDAEFQNKLSFQF